MVSNGPDGATLTEIYRKVALIKLCDEKLRSTITSGRLAAPYYSPRGQEVVSAAMAVCLRPDDYVVTIYRGLHDHLAKGVPLKLLLAEYAGRLAGSCKGKGGPMHITHPESGVMITTGIVGAGNPIAAGLAWASLVKKDGRVTVSNFGDGATNIGAFHEAMNLAAVWQLPVIFVCHNNQYAEHTKLEKCTAVSDIVVRADSYSMPGIKVDGNDAVEMWKASREAVERARTGGGPTLIEAKTFRFFGHNLGDPAHYIPKEERDAWLARDPYPALRRLLSEEFDVPEERLDAIDAEITAEIDAALEFALAADYPPLSELGRDIYAEEIVP